MQICAIEMQNGLPIDIFIQMHIAFKTTLHIKHTEHKHSLGLEIGRLLGLPNLI